MIELKHTPGPWRIMSGMVVSDTPKDEYKTTAVAYCSDEFQHKGGLPYGKERDANAKLIAAAPELLEALQDLLFLVQRSGLNIPAEVSTAPIGKATAAIKKATE